MDRDKENHYETNCERNWLAHRRPDNLRIIN